MNSSIVQLGMNYPDLIPCLPDIEAAYQMLVTCFSAEGKLLLCGNGGSAADADHIVAELAKGFLLKRPVPVSFRAQLESTHGRDGLRLADNLQRALPALALSGHNALATAFANDVAPDLVFAQQVYAYGPEATFFSD